MSWTSCTSPNAEPAGRSGSIARRSARCRGDEAALTADLIELARRYGRYGYRKIAALLKTSGWLVNDKRVERIWRLEGLKVPAQQPKKGRLRDGDGSCLRLRPELRDHVWSYDFVEARTHDGRKFWMLNVVDEFTRECLAIRVDRKLKAAEVIDMLSDLFILRGVPGHIRSDNRLSSSPSQCRPGLRSLAQRPPTSPPARRGRTSMSRALTHRYATSF